MLRHSDGLGRVEVALATFERVEIIENGEAIAILLRERDGTISAVRIAVEQLAD